MPKIKTKRREGRPSEYKVSFCSDVDKYLKESQDGSEEYWKIRGKISDSYDRILKVKLPTLKGFARYIGISEPTLYEWDKKYPEFSKSLDKIREEQYSRLINHGLSGEYNSTIAKLILSSNHGMRERADVTSEDKALPTPLLHALRNNDSDTENSSTD